MEAQGLTVVPELRGEQDRTAEAEQSAAPFPSLAVAKLHPKAQRSSTNMGAVARTFADIRTRTRTCRSASAILKPHRAAGLDMVLEAGTAEVGCMGARAMGARAMRARESVVQVLAVRVRMVVVAGGWEADTVLQHSTEARDTAQYLVLETRHTEAEEWRDLRMVAGGCMDRPRLDWACQAHGWPQGRKKRRRRVKKKLPPLVGALGAFSVGSRGSSGRVWVPLATADRSGFVSGKLL